MTNRFRQIPVDAVKRIVPSTMQQQAIIHGLRYFDGSARAVGRDICYQLTENDQDDMDIS